MGVVVMAAYEVVLGPAARVVVRSLGSRQEREGLAQCLREGLDVGVSSGAAVLLDPDPVDDGLKRYALPVRFLGILVLYRAMSQGELAKLAQQKKRKAELVGYLVFDLIFPESAFYKGQHAA